MTKTERAAFKWKGQLKDWAIAAHLMAGDLQPTHPFVALDLRLIANQLDDLAERMRWKKR